MHTLKKYEKNVIFFELNTITSNIFFFNNLKRTCQIRMSIGNLSLEC